MLSYQKHFQLFEKLSKTAVYVPSRSSHMKHIVKTSCPGIFWPKTEFHSYTLTYMRKWTSFSESSQNFVFGSIYFGPSAMSRNMRKIVKKTKKSPKFGWNGEIPNNFFYGKGLIYSTNQSPLLLFSFFLSIRTYIIQIMVSFQLLKSFIFYFRTSFTTWFNETDFLKISTSDF